MSNERMESFFRKTVETSKNNRNDNGKNDGGKNGLPTQRTEAAQAPQTEEDNSNTITKIVTVSLDAAENYAINFNDGAFAESSDEEVKLVLDELFTATIKILELDIKNISENDAELLTPINPGPHYDSIISEFAIYVNPNMEVVVNVAFGLGSDATVKLTESLSEVKDNVTSLKTYFAEAPVGEIKLGKNYYDSSSE